MAQLIKPFLFWAITNFKYFSIYDSLFDNMLQLLPENITNAFVDILLDPTNARKGDPSQQRYLVF